MTVNEEMDAIIRREHRKHLKQIKLSAVQPAPDSPEEDGDPAFEDLLRNPPAETERKAS